MKNKNGFTLVELIGVVILIGIITLIAVPSVDYIITKTKNNAYNRTLDTLKDGLRNWVTDNKELIYEDGEEIIVTLSDLKEQGYIEYDIKNPKTSTCLANAMQFKITRVKDTEKDTYEYTFLDEELLDGSLKDCEAVSKTPSIYLLGDNPQKIEITNDSTLTYASFDPGATAKSSAGEDISSSIVKSNNVNLKVLGKDYHAKYTIIENGISKTLTRKVYVVDTTAPELNVPEDLEIEIGETLNIMEGVTATDNSGVAPTIKTSGSINYNRPGEYVITYIATDKSGNSVSKDRKITLISKYSYLETYSAGTTENGFRSSSYAHKIISISFIDNDDVPANAVATWDLSEAKDKSITGWIVESTSNTGCYNMYIGSDNRIKANIDSSYWFWHLDNLFTINFDNYDTSDVVNMSYMFAGYDDKIDYGVPISNSIKNYNKPGYLDENDEYEYETLTGYRPVASYNCSNITDIDFSNWNTASAQNMSHMFEGMCYNTRLDLSSFNTSRVTDMSYMFLYNYSVEELILTGWDTSNVTNMAGMFSMDFADDFSLWGNYNIQTLDVTHFDTSNVTNMSEMFKSFGGNYVEIDLSSFDTSNVIDMSYMFYEATLKKLELDMWNIEKVSLIEGMFEYIGVEEKISIDNWNFIGTTDISYMFYYSNAQSISAKNCDVSNITNMSGLFWGTSANFIDTTGWDTSKVTDMSYMFNYSKLENLDLRHFNVSNVTDMSGLFRGVKSNSIDTTGWDTSKVTNMTYMYASTQTDTLNLRHFDVSNVTNMAGLFRDAKSNFIDTTGWDTSKVTTMGYMFYGTSIDTLDLRHFNTANVTSMSYMFYNSKISNINVSGWNVEKVTTLSYMFYGITSLTSLDLSSWSLNSDLDYMTSMFNGTTNLKTIKTPKNIPSTVSMLNITSYAFAGSDGKTYAAGTFPTGNTESITLTR